MTSHMPQGINDLYDRAMSIADDADSLKRKRLLKEAVELYAQAYQMVLQVLPYAVIEPSRSILYCCAAALALDADMAGEAVRLADIGLAGTGIDVDTMANLIEIKEAAQADVEDTKDVD
jgi:hypothetical protein